MNPLLTLANKDPQFLGSLNNIQRLPSAFPFTNVNNSPFMEIPNVASLLCLTNSCSPTDNRSRTSSINSLSSVNNLSPLSGSQIAINQDVNSVLATLKLQQNIQNEIFKAQMQQLFEIKNSLLEKLNQQQLQLEQEEEETIIIPKLQLPIQDKSTISTSAKIETIADLPPKLPQRPIQPLQRKSLKEQIRSMVSFMLDNFGRVGESSLEEEKAKYKYDQDLVKVFNLLASKYSSTIKTKEEMIKYTLRRAFKFIKNNLKKEKNTNTKGVSKVLCDKYFKVTHNDISKIGNEEDFLKVVLPFRKNSKNKTMNTSFIQEVFSSEEFSHDYDKFLACFTFMLEADNKSKLDRFITFLEECVHKKKIEAIKTYKRIPWPQLWISNTKNIAQSLPTMGIQGADSPSDSKKRVKMEADLNGFPKSNDSQSDISTDSNSNF